MKKIGIVNLLLLLLFVSAASAEFYRYKDAHGNTIYTDDLSKVPKAQRSQASVYEESPAQAQVQPEKAPGPANGAEMDFEKEAGRLLGIKSQLDKEYDELASESDRLKAEQKEAVTPDQIREVNKKVVEYNTRFQSYQEKHAAYENEVKIYNERLKAAEAPQESDGSGQNR